MSGSGELTELKVGDRVEGWCPKSRRWVKVTVTRVSVKSFQGTEVTADRNFEKWAGLTQWRKPGDNQEWHHSKLGEYKQLKLVEDGSANSSEPACRWHEPRKRWNDRGEFLNTCSHCRQEEQINDVEELKAQLATFPSVLAQLEAGLNRATAKSRKEEFLKDIQCKHRQIEYLENRIQELSAPPSPSGQSCTCHHQSRIDGCSDCGWFTTIPWNERDAWGDEPLDPDDVWRVGDRVQWQKGLHQFGTVKGLHQQELLGGKLPLIVVRWDGFDSDVFISPSELFRIWEGKEQSKVNSPEPSTQINSPELTKKRSPKGTRKYEGRCDKGQVNLSGRIERQTKHKKLSSGELKSYEYNLYRYQLGGVGKVYSKVIPLGKLAEIAEAIAAGHPAEIIVKWFWR